MPRKRARNQDGEFLGDNLSTPDVNEAWIEEETPMEDEVKEVEAAAPAPAQVELKSADPEPEKAPEAPAKEAIETDVRKKLERKTDGGENPFVPQNQASLEKEAKKVAEEKGFDLTRGTSIGARLMARRRLG